MAGSLSILIVLALLVPLWVLLRRDFIKGLCYGVFLCVSMPTYLRIPLPGSLPQLTIYRLILITALFFWFRYRDPAQRLSQAPLFGAFCFWAVANLLSLLFTTGDFVASLKRYLDFVVEAALFFLLLVTSLRSRDDAMRVLRAACLGVALVAALAFIEKYTRFNPVNYLLSNAAADSGEENHAGFGDVSATYQHRILLGTGMAMGWPLVVALMLAAKDRRRRASFLWLLLALVLAACYFGNSRGPWLAAALAGATLVILGGSAIRRKLMLVLVLALAVVLSRPGVYRMLVHDAQATADTDSFKGGTFRYRIELWKVAWAEISASPDRLLFGCGPGCGLDSTVDWKLSYRGGRAEEIWSWDNQMAYDLYQSGLLGLAASLTLYGSLLFALCRFWRNADSVAKPIVACLLASALAYEFMLSNVLMFTKPVNFLFWTIAAISYAIRLNPQSQELEILDPGFVETVPSCSRTQSGAGEPVAAAHEEFPRRGSRLKECIKPFDNQPCCLKKRHLMAGDGWLKL